MNPPKKLALNSTFRKLRSWHLVPSLHGKKMKKQWKQWQTIFGGSKITADSDCSHEIKRCLLLGRKAMTNLDSILNSRDIAFPTKVHLVKAMIFPVITYGCESWTIKEAGRIDAFKLWCWRSLLRVPWDHKELQPVNPKGNQLWMFIGRTDAEAPILGPPDAKSQLIGKIPWCWQRLRAGEEEGGRGWDS